MDKRYFWCFLAVAIGLALAVGEVSSLFAQEASEEFTLDEITVTAQKREENQQKVPIAMEVISGESIQEMGMNDIDDILANVSSVMINTGVDGYRVSIRGMSNDNAAFKGVMQASTPTVAVNTDGIYTNRNSSGQGLYDVERVEVLYGPQSTLYASASPGGVVNIVTANPKTDKYEFSGSLEYGNYNLLHTEGSVNAPLNSQMALRASFSTSKHDGYLSNGSSDEDSRSGRLKALYQPSDRLSIVLTGEYSKSKGQGFAGVEQFVDQDEPDDPWTSTSDTAGLGMERVNKKISARMDLDLGYVGSISIAPSYSKITNDQEGISSGADMMGNATSTLNVNSGTGDEKGGEIRMVSSSDFPFKWIIGGNIYKAKDDQVRTGYDPDDPSTPTSINRTWNEQNTKAVYANITYPFSDRFRGTGGVRMTWDENKSYNYEWPQGPNNETRIDDQDPMEYNDPSYKVGAEYDLAENSMVYGDISTSYRTQGMSFSDSGETFDPEELTAFTIGVKNRFFGNKLQVNVSAYDYEYKNYLASGDPHQIIIDANGNGVVDADEGDDRSEWEEEAAKEVGDARIYGFDIQTSTIVTDKDKVDLSVSYIHKAFEDLVFDWSDFTNDAMGLPDVDYGGEQMPNAPKWTINTGYTHNFMLWNGGSLSAKLDIRWQSSYVLNWQAWQITQLDEPVDGKYFTITDTSDVRVQEAYRLINFSMAYSHPTGKWSLSGYVNNVENYAVKRSLMQGDMMIGDPRTYGAVLSVRFQ